METVHSKVRKRDKGKNVWQFSGTAGRRYIMALGR